MADDNGDYIPQLMTRLLAVLHASGAREMAELGLSVPAARALVVLLRHGPMRVSRLADLVGLEPTGLSHLMRTLEHRRLIARERQADDHRAVIAALTSQGRAQARICDEIYEQTESSLLRNLPQADVSRLRGLLEQMLENANGSN
jgi:DNA-binding MarR family transcriptional regulator